MYKMFDSTCQLSLVGAPNRSLNLANVATRPHPEGGAGGRRPVLRSSMNCYEGGRRPEAGGYFPHQYSYFTIDYYSLLVPVPQTPI
jgi:hypothetical protein